MRSHVIAALAWFALVTPALAEEAPYYYDEQAGGWRNGAPPPPPAGANGEANAEVSVDLPAPGPSASYGAFHDGLAPYGEWITVAPYGRVWRPQRVAAGWRPYYYGRWEWTDEGWLWVSDEPWGWAAYHYGRWAYDAGYGWVWIPGYEWAPAWVTWRYSPEYIGWAPLGPGFSVYVTSYPVVYGWWTFVPCQRFVGVPVHSVAYTGAYARGIYHTTQPAPPHAAVYGARAPAWGGPARPFVEQRSGRPISAVRVQPVASPGMAIGSARAGVVPIYRPEARVPVAPRAAQPPPASVITHSPTAPAPNGRLPAPAPPPGNYVRAPGTARPQQGAYAAPHPARPPAPAPTSPRAAPVTAPAPAPARPAPPPTRAPQGQRSPQFQPPRGHPSPAIAQATRGGRGSHRPFR